MTRIKGLILTLLYALLGALGLTLAIPPGFASPIFPAAGFGLAAVFYYGPKAALYIGLGSFILNFGRILLVGDFAWSTTFAIFFVALGAAMQGWLGAYLAKRYIDSGINKLDTEAQILKFLFWGGILACLTSASIAISSLWVTNVLKTDSLLASWWTWYLGDLLGVAIFAPLALLYFNSSDTLSKVRRRRIVIPTVIALILSLLLYAAAAHQERLQVQEHLKSDVTTLAKRIQDRLNAHQVILASMAHFIEANPQFSYQQFEHFTQASLIENSDLFALSYNDIVLARNLKAYEQEMSKSSPIANFHATQRDENKKLIPVQERPDYVIVRYIVPLMGNLPAVGFDINSEPTRREAITRSRVSGKPAVTAPIRLVQEDGVRVGVLVLHPVYGSMYSPKEQRWRLIGFSVGVIKVDELISIAASTKVPNDLHFSIRDARVDASDLYFFGTPPSQDIEAYRQFSVNLNVADRQWQLQAWAGDSYVHQSKRWTSWSIGVIALLFTGLLQIYLHGMTGVTLTLRRRNEELIEKQSQLNLADTVFMNIAEAIVVTDPIGNVISINPAFTKITGYEIDDLKGKSIGLIKSGPHTIEFYKDLWKKLIEQGCWQGEITNRRKNGEFFTEQLTINAVMNPQGLAVYYVGTFADVTEKKMAQDQMEFLAYHDALTGLPNRVLGQQKVQEAISRAQRHGYQVSILFMDLDYFKLVNDTYGHSLGDKLLQEVSRRLQAHVRAEDSLCRLSGDEFMLIVEHVQQVEDIATNCEHLLAEIEKPFLIDGRMMQTSLSVGIAVYPNDGELVEDLLRKADTAMFEAKQGGRNTYRFFSQGMNQSVVEFVQTRDALMRAIREHEFQLYYQPQINLADGSIIGVEALLRWDHPRLGILGPDRIITVAEQSGLIVAIGQWVLQEATRQMKVWSDLGLPMRTVSVNISAIQFRSGNLEKTISDALESAGLPANCLELELTESVLIDDRDKALRVITRLKESGLKLSIDDFGTGYSSMAYLRRLHVDKIKIDASFVRGLGVNPEDAAIVRSILQMAHSLELEAIAEGVETKDALDILRNMGCDQIQGYYYAQPMKPEDFVVWVNTYDSIS